MSAAHIFSVTVTDSLGATDSQAFTLNLSPAAAATTVTITSSATAGQFANGATLTYNTTATTNSGQPITYSMTGAPAGWTISSAGVITSAPLTAAGSFTFTVAAVSAGVTATKNVAYTVAAAPVVVVPGVPPLIVPVMGPYQLAPGTTVTAQVGATGVGPFTYGLGAGAPSGATITPSGFLVMNGSTIPSGNQQIAVVVTDSSGATTTSIVSVYVGSLQSFLTRIVSANKSILTRYFKVV